MAKDEELSPGMGPAIPGGVYETAPGSGRFVDAHGRSVNKDGRLLNGDDLPGAVNAEADEAWRADMEKQRRASARNTPGAANTQVTELDSMSVDELTAMAEKQGVTVEGTGANGRVLKADLISALGG
jgi:hypothetical protein